MSTAENFQGKYMPFLAGAGTFFLPCGFTLLVQTIALTAGSFFASGLIMFVFALGTLIPLAGISISSIKLQTNPKFAGTFNLIVGVMIIAFGVYNINSQLVVLGLPNLSTVKAQTRQQTVQKVGKNSEGFGSEIVTVGGKEQQNISILAQGFSYEPRAITLRAGIPTNLTVTNDNSIGCAQAMYLQGLSNEILYIDKPTVTTTFTPKQGTYYISCTMGMVEPIVVTVI